MTFDGYLVVTLDVFVATTNIIIHARNLNITMDNVVLLDANENRLPIALIVYNPTLDQLTIALTTMLQIGVGYVLEINYRGSINAPMDAGLIYTSYRDLNGTQQSDTYCPVFDYCLFCHLLVLCSQLNLSPSLLDRCFHHSTSRHTRLSFISHSSIRLPMSHSEICSNDRLASTYSNHLYI